MKIIYFWGFFLTLRSSQIEAIHAQAINERTQEGRWTPFSKAIQNMFLLLYPFCFAVWQALCSSLTQSAQPQFSPPYTPGYPLGGGGIGPQQQQQTFPAPNTLAPASNQGSILQTAPTASLSFPGIYTNSNLTITSTSLSVFSNYPGTLGTTASCLVSGADLDKAQAIFRLPPFAVLTGDSETVYNELAAAEIAAFCAQKGQPGSYCFRSNLTHADAERIAANPSMYPLSSLPLPFPLASGQWGGFGPYYAACAEVVVVRCPSGVIERCAENYICYDPALNTAIGSISSATTNTLNPANAPSGTLAPSSSSSNVLTTTPTTTGILGNTTSMQGNTPGIQGNSGEARPSVSCG